MNECKTLIIDDEETYANGLQRLLARRGIHAEVAVTMAEGLQKARALEPVLVILDHLLPDGSGLDMITPLRQLRPAPTVLMMTAYGTIAHAVEAMRRGASDYVPKSTSLSDVVERVAEAEQVARAARQVSAPSAQSSSNVAGALLGDSASMRQVRARLMEVASSPDTTVLLSGESGTGKGVAARLIHSLSSRSSEPFCAIDCVALPAPLAESELFGHERGAFTGADKLKPGRLELAGHGTVLLDEIGDMEWTLQAKLLRVLEERTFERVGGVKPVQFHARVIAASHRELSDLVQEKKFRLDLYHRLSVFPIHLPPLRERGEDILSLAQHFLSEFSTRLNKQLVLTHEVAALLLNYDFPGNVRELRNLMERAAILAAPTATTITPELLPPRIGELTIARQISEPVPGTRAPGMTLTFEPGRDTLENLEKRLLEEALRMANGKKVKAAEILGISRFALLRRVEKYGLG